MARRNVAVALYGSPDLIPAGLKKVAVILDNKLTVPNREAAEWATTFYSPGQAVPANALKVGGVIYARGDTIPPDMLLVTGWYPSDTATPQLNEPFLGAAVDTDLWTKTDTQTGNPHISVSGGNLVIAAPPGNGWAQTALVDTQSWARVAGLTVEWEVTPGATNKLLCLGFTDGSLIAEALEAHAIYINDNGYLYISQAAGLKDLPLAYTAVSTWLRIVLLATGALYYVSTDNRATWKLIWKDATVTTTPLYAFIESYNAALTAASCRVYLGSVKAAVLGPTTPGAPALVAGSELLTNGNMETGSPPSSWNAASATLSAAADERTGGAGTQSISVASSGEAPGWAYQSATQAAGAWVIVAGWAKNVSATSALLRLFTAGGGALIAQASMSGAAWASLGFAARLPSANPEFWLYIDTAVLGQAVRFDDISMKPLPFDQTGVLEYISDAGVKQAIFDANITCAAGYHAGFVVCADSATAPVYNLLAYVDRTAAKAYLLKNVNGTWTEMVAAAITYSAGAQLRLIGIGSSWGLYYNGALCGSIQTLDVSANYGTHCHKFVTSVNETVAAFEVNN